MPAPNLLLVSSSRFRDLPAFAHAEAEIKAHFQGVPEICFIPYADPGGAGQAAYTEKIKTQFAAMGLSIRGLNE
ncbi:MAG: dipeptidase PepE, partial [Bacteroidetes bacterium]